MIRSINDCSNCLCYINIKYIFSLHNLVGMSSLVFMYIYTYFKTYAITRHKIYLDKRINTVKKYFFNTAMYIVHRHHITYNVN